MKLVINDRIVLLRAPEGPLAPYIVSFSKWVVGQGYALGSQRQRIRIAVAFSQWLSRKSLRLRSVSSQHTVQFLRHRARRQGIQDGDVTALRQLVDFLRDEGAIPVEKIHEEPSSPAERCVRAFEL